MIKTYEILNDGAFVVTKDKEEGLLSFGYYHNVYNGDTEERIFEPIAPVNAVETEEIIKYLYKAQ